jgi:hypothetical protein
MSIETFSPLPLGRFGGWITLLDPSDVPPGMSPNLGDVEFFAGGVRTRAGLVSQFAPLAGAPAVNGLKTYITANLIDRLLAFDALGNLYKEATPGTLALVASPGTPNLYLASTTLFGREYMAFSNALLGQDLPRQFDDTYFDRVSQIGPGAGPTAADATAAGNITAGVHQVSVIFVTRQGFWTAPSPPVSWTAAGGKKVTLTNIPTGPSNIVQRLLAFTAEGGADFYQIPASMTINDNTTTTLTLDFDDTLLLSGVEMDNQFGQIELPNQLGVIDYSDRLFWWGERAKMPNWNNITFDGGWALGAGTGGSDVPLGWTSDPTSGAGGSRESSDVVWGDAYRITANASSVARGMIEQSAVTDPFGNALLVRNTDYSVRARIKRSTNLAQGTLRINCFSPTAGAIGSGLAISATQASTYYVEFTADLIPPQTSIPADMVLRVYADGVPGPNGESFLVDQIEIFPTNAPQNASLIRASRALNAESYDGVTGLMLVAENNGQGIRAAFRLRNYLYFVKERSFYVTQDDGVNEPDLWSIEEVSNQVGTPSAHGVGIGEEWVVIAGRAGLYLFNGGNPIKLSQEIQPTWDAINWSAGQTIWVQVDTQHKRILVGVPMGSATQPSQILVLDYTEGFTDPLQTMLSVPGYGRAWTQWMIPANSCGLIERPNGTAQLFFGNNSVSGASTGKILGLTPGTLSDDGAAINSYYTTAFLSRTGLGGRNLFGYATANVQGAGTLALSALLPGNVAQGIGSWPLASPATQDLEMFTSILAERVAYQLSTSAAGAWFSLTKLVPYAKPDPWSVVRGHN